MPELVSIFAVGFLLSLSANIANYMFSIRSFGRLEILILQRNLSRVGRFWSFNHRAVSDVVVASDFDQSIANDRKMASRSLVVLGVLLTAMSWLGLLGLGLYFISVNMLAKSRIEQKIFASALVSSDLPKEEVQRLIQNFEAS
jgi:hypothetical protein